MPPTAEVDGSEDVNDFLLRIRELGDQRDKEDEERTRKLEEEIMQGRKERQARRAGTFPIEWDALDLQASSRGDGEVFTLIDFRRARQVFVSKQR